VIKSEVKNSCLFSPNPAREGFKEIACALKPSLAGEGYIKKFPSFTSLLIVPIEFMQFLSF